MSRYTLAALAAAALLVLGASPARAGGDWNDAGIDWKSFEAGLAQAKAEDKPVCLIFYTDWCPHCGKYSTVFHNDEVVKTAKRFVMIRVERDANKEISSRFAPDGEYIPRTYFLTPAAELREEIHEQRPTYKYFYNTGGSASLLRGMREALGDQKTPGAKEPAA